MKKRVSAAILAICAVAIAPLNAGAATFVSGGSLLLNGQSADQIGEWLGQGDVVLTNIFSGNPSSTTTDFHTAADGKGATITVAVGREAGGLPDSPLYLLGGYNPQSWNSFSGATVTVNEADKTAFIFNLTSRAKFAQIDTTQTFNDIAFGPTFGGSEFSNSFGIGRPNNLLVAGLGRYEAGTLSWGTGYLGSYGGSGFAPTILDPLNGFGGSNFLIYSLEVFTVTPVPEPSTYALMFAGLAFVAFAAKRRRGIDASRPA